MGASWLEVGVTHHPGHSIIFVGCGDCDCYGYLTL